MPKRTAGGPRTRALSRKQGRRIVALLRRLPRVAPEISLRPLTGPGFEVTLREVGDFVAPLDVGAEAFYADYDARTRELVEASLLWVSRRFRVHGAWCVEAVAAGGAPGNHGFALVWHGHTYYRLGAGRLQVVDPQRRDQPEAHPFPLQLGPSFESEVMRLAGYWLVSVNGIEHECLRVDSLCREPDEPAAAIRDERYLSREGRTVMLRRSQTPQRAEYYARLGGRLQPRAPDRHSAPTTVCEGLEFIDWFDLLTDVALGPLAAGAISLTRRAM